MSEIGGEMTWSAVPAPNRHRRRAAGRAEPSGSTAHRGTGRGSALDVGLTVPVGRCAGGRAGGARSRGSLVAATPVVALAALLAGCTGPNSGPAAPLTTVTSSTTTSTGTPASTAPSSTPTNAVADAALAAYTGMWKATARASWTSDWQSPELARYARDAALQKITQALYADRQRGVTAKGEPTLSARVTDLVPVGAPTEARVLDCGDSSGWLKYRADGQPLDEEPGGRRRITATVTLDAGAWKVTDFAVQGVGSC